MARVHLAPRAAAVVVIAMHAHELNRRQVEEFHAALIKAHGAPLREQLFAVPSSLRWVAVVRNRLFADREPQRFFAATHDSAEQIAHEQGCSRPDLYVVCEYCARRLRVVNLASTERLLRAHQSTERCLYRSILALSLWAGFAPLDGRGAHYAPDARAALGAFDSIGQERQAARAWSSMVRALALAVLRVKTFRRRTPNLPRAASPSALLVNSETTALTLDELESLQAADVDPFWTNRAMAWSEELVFYRGFERVSDAYDYLGSRAILETQEQP